MKKIFTFMAVAAAMTLTAQAQELIIPTNVDNPNVTIFNNGNFDAASYGIGSTNQETRISLGTVDFGEAGENFKAAGLRFANGWGGNIGVAVLTAGEGDDAVEFARISLIETKGYGQFKTIAANMSAAPTGVQEVFLTFENRAGNIRAAYFYADELTADDFSEGSILKTPAEQDGYDQISAKLDVLNSVKLEGSNDARLDGDSWGWTSGGVVVDYGALDFGSGDYSQLVAYFKHGGWGLINFFEVYIDEIAPANKIAQVYAGLEINSLIPAARNLEQTVTGVHNVLVKWYGGSINVGNLEFVKGNLWLEEPFYAAVPAVPSENAVRYSFRKDFFVNPVEGVVFIGRNFVMNDNDEWVGQNVSDRTEIVNQGQWEDNNVGWTGNGTVLKVKDVDFAEGNFNKLIVEYGSEPANANSFENSIKFYVDSQDGDPVATVNIVGTGNWNTIFQAGGDLAAVEGVHDLYMVYSAGINVKDFYLDGPAPAVKSAINFEAELDNATMQVLVDNEPIESGDEVAEGTLVTVVVTPADGYQVNGITVAPAVAEPGLKAAPRRVDVEPAGENTFTFTMPAEPVTISAEVVESVHTGVADINVADNAAVKYVNAMGQVSDRPFQGINIVISGNKVTKVIK